MINEKLMFLRLSGRAHTRNSQTAQFRPLMLIHRHEMILCGRSIICRENTRLTLILIARTVQSCPTRCTRTARCPTGCTRTARSLTLGTAQPDIRFTRAGAQSCPTGCTRTAQLITTACLGTIRSYTTCTRALLLRPLSTSLSRSASENSRIRHPRTSNPQIAS